MLLSYTFSLHVCDAQAATAAVCYANACNIHLPPSVPALLLRTLPHPASPCLAAERLLL